MDKLIASEKARKILKAAIEAGVVPQGEIIVVLVADGQGKVDVATVAPSARAAELVPAVLFMAMHDTGGATAELVDRIAVGKS